VKILYIDSEAGDEARAMTLLLGLRGHEVEYTSDYAAVHRLATESRPDLILARARWKSKCRLFALVRQLQADPLFAGTPMFALRNCNGIKREEAIAAGFDLVEDIPLAIEDLNTRQDRVIF
jgi:CheY-like chemotaxis protein